MRRISVRRYLLAALLVVVVFLVLPAILIVWDGLTDEIGVADVGIVLGTTVEESGDLSPRLEARLSKAVELYNEGMFAEIIVSGGVGREGHNEAEVMKQYLIGAGVPEDRIHVDAAGNDTYLTARNASRFMGEEGMRSALVISQYFHISRAKLALERFGVSPLYAAHADIFELRDLYSIPREVIALYVYFFRDYD